MQLCIISQQTRLVGKVEKAFVRPGTVKSSNWVGIG